MGLFHITGVAFLSTGWGKFPNNSMSKYALIPGVQVQDPVETGRAGLPHVRRAGEVLEPVLRFGCGGQQDRDEAGADRELHLPQRAHQLRTAGQRPAGPRETLEGGQRHTPGNPPDQEGGGQCCRLRNGFGGAEKNLEQAT